MQPRLSTWLPALGLLALAASAWFGLTHLAMERLPHPLELTGVSSSEAPPAASRADLGHLGLPARVPADPATRRAEPGPEAFELVGMVTGIDPAAETAERPLLVVVRAITAPGASCGLQPGSTAALSWGRGTRVEPAGLLEDGGFPANLMGAKIRAEGRIHSAGAEGCKLMAAHIRVS